MKVFTLTVDFPIDQPILFSGEAIEWKGDVCEYIIITEFIAVPFLEETSAQLINDSKKIPPLESSYGNRLIYKPIDLNLSMDIIEDLSPKTYKSVEGMTLLITFHKTVQIKDWNRCKNLLDCFNQTYLYEKYKFPMKILIENNIDGFLMVDRKREMFYKEKYVHSLDLFFYDLPHSSSNNRVPALYTSDNVKIIPCSIFRSESDSSDDYVPSNIYEFGLNHPRQGNVTILRHRKDKIGTADSWSKCKKLLKTAEYDYMETIDIQCKRDPIQIICYLIRQH